MKRYDALANRATGMAFILGPAFITIAAAAVAMEIGINEGGTESVIDGIFLAYGVVIFVPIFLTLGGILGDRAPRFAIVLVTLGILSTVGGVAAAMSRIFEGTLLESGGTIETTIFDAISETEASLVLGIAAIFFPLVTIIMGLALLRSDGIPSFAAGLFAVGGICFILGQAADIALKVTYLLAGLAWFVGLAPLGLQRLRGENTPHTTARIPD